MNDAVGVSVVDGLGQRYDQSRRQPWRLRVPADPTSQAPAFDEFHGKVWPARLLANVVDLDDVRVMQTADRPTLLLEPLPHLPE